ncbi:MAG TPA: hypothetical protein VIM17_12265, partial [Jatrophihabitantaceae bacterium]
TTQDPARSAARVLGDYPRASPNPTLDARGVPFTAEPLSSHGEVIQLNARCARAGPHRQTVPS